MLPERLESTAERLYYKSDLKKVVSVIKTHEIEEVHF